MGISWCGKIRRAFIEFLGYDLNYLKSGVYIIVLITKIFVLLRFVLSHLFGNLKSSDY